MYVAIDSVIEQRFKKKLVGGQTSQVRGVRDADQIGSGNRVC
jgi:hypothetical protein